MQKLPSFLLCLAALAGLCACKQTSSARRAAPYDQGPALFAVTSGDKFGYINAQGDIVIEPRFLRALSFSDGLGAVQDETGRWGFVDRTGKYAIEPTFEQVLPFAEGYASVRVGNKFTVIDTSGTAMFEAKYAGVSQFFEGLAPTLMSMPVPGGVMATAWGFINPNGDFVIPAQYDGVTPFSDGLAAVRALGKLWGYIDRDGKYVIEPRFETANRFSEGLASVEEGLSAKYRWGFIDTKGKMVIEPRFSLARIFSEGLAGVQVEDAKWGYVDRQGEWVIKAEFDDVSPFVEGIALVKKGDDQLYIDKTGKQIWPKQ